MNLDRNDALYALAIEHGDYRAATYAALRAVRRTGGDSLWTIRLRGAFARRNRRRTR